jgi:flagellin
MSFRINTNVSAMNALRNVTGTGDQLSKSITRLSTGLRINSAADDPAGLIISRSFKAQIGGVDQAMKNSQDAINYVKTAEGALNEVSNLLNDARGLAVAAANNGTLTSSQIQANQSQLNSIVSSVTRIAQTTQYGTKKLLDGSSGVNASVTDGTKISQLSIGGTLGGAAVSSNSSVVVTVNAASTQATFSSRDFGADDTTALGAANAGSFTLNGVTIVGEATDNAATVRDKINNVADQTGIVATTDNTGVIVLKSTGYGTGAKINLSDATGAIRTGAGYTAAAGTDGNATVTVGGTSALFTASRNGSDGLTFTDASGNSFTVTSAGNTAGASMQNATVGQVVVGAANFQIGANSGQTTTFSIGNFQASNLGAGAVSGLTMNNLDLTTASGASQALQVIDKAIEQVSKARGDMGNFQSNVLESNIRSLGTAKENMSATVSSIEDVDVAQEMTNYTKLQILQQAGMSVLSQANSAPQAVLSLLR